MAAISCQEELLEVSWDQRYECAGAWRQCDGVTGVRCLVQAGPER